MALRDPANAHWRDSARPAMFFIMSAYSVLPFVVFLLHMRLFTFIFACITSIFFAVLEKFGFTIPIFRRWIKVFLIGKTRYARPWWS